MDKQGDNYKSFNYLLMCLPPEGILSSVGDMSEQRLALES